MSNTISPILLSCEPYILQQSAWRETHWWNSGTQLMGLNNNFIIGLKACSTNLNPYIVPWSWQRTYGYRGHTPKWEPSTIILLNGNGIKRSLTDSSLYPQTSISLNSPQRNFYLQYMTISSMITWSRYR